MRISIRTMSISKTSIPTPTRRSTSYSMWIFKRAPFRPKGRMFRHAVVGLALAVALIAMLPGCTKVESSGASGLHPWTIPGTMRWADGEEPDNLNPLLSTELLVNDLSAFTMGYFFQFGPRGEAVPDLCVEVPTQANGDISADGRTLRFKLRHGVAWSDGAPFTSADVAFSVRAILNPRNNVLSREGWDLIQRVETPDPYTVVFHLRQPFAPFLDKFFTPVGNPAILPEHLLAKYPDLNHVAYNQLPVGLGPFVYTAWRRGNEVEMAANPHYWGGPLKLKHVIFKIIPDANTVLTQVRTHELDVDVRVPANEVSEVRSLPGVRTIDVVSNSFRHLDFNLSRPALRDLRVRQAIAHATDRRAIWEKVYHRVGVVSNAPFPSSSWAYAPGLPGYAYDLGAAARLLDEAGWRLGSDGLRHRKGEALRLTLVGNIGNPLLDSTVLVIESSFKRLGIELEYKRYPTPLLFGSYAAGGIIATGKYDLAIYAWQLQPDPDLSLLLECRSVPPHALNYVRYCNPAFDRLQEDADTHYDRARRRRDLIAEQRILSHDLPWIVISNIEEVFALNPDLKGLAPDLDEVFWNAAQLSM
ncbi:peptide ABC transporter substrate-binding protein [bacterium]|nr:MAG: peptide ABC transporter substrate-binding protein [bacterium]